ncbi:unnamed protein product [Brassicogethes aeneus]|uniref:Timeless C-terminal domain-containing protein n=1 Tax=Brassicogethes aeneus TaxID=1431903 RepID=A0A9P0B4R6_BRAAE|nr:unnamed protein product [Brassicogethes aeneus]
MRCESDFRFEDFTKRLANPKAVRACGLALKKFDKNSVNTNHCIIKLLHRIAFDCKMYVMLFQVSIFKTFQRIFSMKEVPEYKELAKFGTYVMRQFFKVAEINNKVYMESLFWKSSRTAYDIEQGYGSYQEKSSASAKTWTEQEEDELRRLFVEHQRDHQEEDVVDWICSNLIDNTRTRRVVLHKLKEMCLIIDYKKSRLQKSAVNIKVPQNWGAEEETQLRDLFEHFQEAIDPLTCIMDRLTVKRPKNRIVEKLLVMGLIQDKSEMRKKKAPRGNKSRKSKMANDDSDDDSIRSGSGDESDGGSSRSSSRQSHQLNKINKKKPTAKGKHTKVSAAKLAKQLIDLVDKEMSEPLEWLKESISDAIEDYDDDDNEGIPLVPIMDYAVTAMENAEFQNLLKSFGVLEPFDEQESYWRIPGHLNLETLKSHCNLLEKALEKTLTIPEENNENQSSDDDDVFDRIKKQVKEIRLKEKIKESGRKRGEEVQFNEEIFAKKIDHHFPQPNDNSEDSSDVPEAHSSKKKINKRRIAPMEDSDDSNESFANKFSKSTLAQINESEDSNDAPEPARKVNKRKIQRFDDSEDSNDVPSLTIAEDDEESEEENAPKKKPGRIMDSDDEDSEEDKENDTDVVPINESEDSNDVPNLIIAEDDEEREEENVPKKKPGRIMDSDDEDSNEGVQKTQKTTSQKAQNKNKIGRMEDSDSEEDKENDTDAANVANEAELKRIRSNSSSDTEKPLPKRSRVLDSDDED